MARYLPDFPVGNGQFENLNPTPICENLPRASSPVLSIREQIRLEMELSRREQEELKDYDDDDDFEFDDDPYYIEDDDGYEGDEVGDTESITAEKAGQDAPPAVVHSEADAGATASVPKEVETKDD